MTETILKTDIHQEASFLEKYTKSAIDLTVEYTPKIILATIVLIVGFWLIKKLTRLSEKAMQRRDLDISLRTFLKSLISIGLKILLLITVAGMIGIQTTSLVTVLGAAGLAVGLALQGSLSNFAGGVLVLVFKPFKVGDYIEALGQKGTVKEIQIFSTILITVDNKTIMLPNGSVSNNIIVNQSIEGTLRGTLTVNISNEFDSDVVKKLILDTILKDERVIINVHPPTVICTKAGGGTYTLQANFFTTEADNGLTTASITENVNKELVKHKIGEPMPHMVVHQAQ